jgi:AraC-like DNA-binding protein
MEPAEPRAALARHRLVDTRSPDEAREAIGRIFCPHFLRPLKARPSAFHARHDSLRQDGYSVNLVAYGAEVDIDPGELKGFFLLQWPLRGSARVRCGSDEVEAAAGERASLLSPTLLTRMTWSEGCEKAIVLVRREALQLQLEALNGRPAGPVEFSVGIEMRAALGRQLLGHINLMIAAAENDAPAAYQTLLRDAFTTLLLKGQPHNQTGGMGAGAGVAPPGAVRRAEAYIEAHLRDAMTMEQIARASGASLRSLQESFRKARGVTLSEFIQRRRLELFHRRLSDPSAPSSIIEIAYSVGLAHLGRAAAAYRELYGETPRETLRRR